MPSTTLYELGEYLLDLDRMLEESKGEITPEIEGLLGETEEAIRSKVDGLGRFIRCLEAHRDSCTEEADRLKDKADAADHKIDRLKSYVESVMVRTGRDRFAGAIFTVRRQRNGGKEPLTLLIRPEDLPLEFRYSVPIQYKANEDAIRQAMKASGIDMLCAEVPATINGQPDTILTPIARLEPRGFHLRVE